MLCRKCGLKVSGKGGMSEAQAVWKMTQNLPAELQDSRVGELLSECLDTVMQNHLSLATRLDLLDWFVQTA